MPRIHTSTSSSTSSGCLSYSDILSDGGVVNQNPDGSISVFIPNIYGALAPYPLTKSCCKVLNSNYTFNVDTQKCMWSDSSSCDITNPFKITLNPKGNDGTIFYVDSNDTCYLSIDFDYLFKFKCETLVNAITQGIPQTPTNIALEAQIAALQVQIANQIVSCEAIGAQIDVLIPSITATSYSIVCDTLPQPPPSGPSTPPPPQTGREISFGGTAFGKVAPLSFGATDSISAGQLYCLTEPQGLAEWANILGPVNYAAFLNGDPNSYTCNDVQEIFSENDIIVNNNLLGAGATQPVLLVACDVPFGTKTDLVTQLNDLISQSNACNASLSALTTHLTALETTLNPNATICDSPVGILESLDVSLTLDVVNSANTLTTIAEFPLFPEIGSGNLYNYLTTHSDSGFYICGDPTPTETTFSPCTPLSLNLSAITSQNVLSCNNIMDVIVDNLFNESGLSGATDGAFIFTSSLKPDALASNWLHYHTLITNPSILSGITNQKIKISLKINNTCSDLCVLVDEIELDKVCTHVSNTSIFLTQSPGFGLERIRDNKKSWTANTTTTNRPFVITNNKGGNGIRETNYDVNDEKLVINTKEIDLDISIASAIETDVWCYLSNNPCLLTGITYCNPCGENCGNKTFQDDMCYDFQDDYLYEFMDGTGNTNTTRTMSCCGDNLIDFQSLMTQPLSSITTVEDFEYFLSSELIDAKDRQTLSGYPTLRALYERYLNSYVFCQNNSSAYNYLTMDQFASLVGDYWVDIVEQVVPATTIWGSVKIYSNTIFDQQKFKYRSYTSLFCENPYSGETVPSPINGTSGFCEGVDVSYTPIVMNTGSGVKVSNPIIVNCGSICLAQMNAGSEFIGTVGVISNKTTTSTGFGHGHVVFSENLGG